MKTKGKLTLVKSSTSLLLDTSQVDCLHDADVARAATYAIAAPFPMLHARWSKRRLEAMEPWHEGKAGR